MSSSKGTALPSHVAIIMDGNGRWAVQRGQLRQAGHKAGVRPVRMCIEQCAHRGISALTLFAFSSENWGRPGEEVGALMSLFVQALDDELDELHRSGVRVRFIGDLRGFPVRLQGRCGGADRRQHGAEPADRRWLRRALGHRARRACVGSTLRERGVAAGGHR
jgi:undecaprenyl diphosphate synthase